MKNYCLIKDGVIVDGPRVLPQNTDSVSNFHLLSDEELKCYGWLPLRLAGEPAENQELVNSVREVFETEVVETRIYRDLTAEELLEREEWAKNLSPDPFSAGQILSLDEMLKQIFPDQDGESQ